MPEKEQSGAFDDEYLEDGFVCTVGQGICLCGGPIECAVARLEPSQRESILEDVRNALTEAGEFYADEGGRDGAAAAQLVGAAFGIWRMSAYRSHGRGMRFAFIFRQILHATKVARAGGPKR